MQAVSPGSLPLPIALMLVMAALFVAAWAGGLAGRSRQTSIGVTLIYMSIAAVPAARIAFVINHFEIYRNAPWSMLDILDDGFSPWAGLAAALLVAAWRGWRSASLRKPLVVGLAAGALAWGGMSGAISKLTNASLPTVTLTTLAGEPVDIVALAGGKPMVVNLWASWCPPCRREMPVLAAAQKQEKDVLFVFADQGEDGTTARNYLVGARLDLANVLLNPSADFGREAGSTGLPTTLFYDADGRLVDTNVGELSPELLAGKLDRLRARPAKE